MLLQSYTAGLLGTPANQVRHALSGSLHDAIKIAVAVDQTDQQEHHSGSFYVERRN
jgi:hypothetical protein